MPRPSEFHRRPLGCRRPTASYFENRNPADTARPDRALPDSRARPTSTRRSRRRSAGFALWWRTPAPARGDVLRRVGDLLVARKEELADAMTREMGKVLAETRGDVQEGIDTAYYAATEGRRLFGHTVPSRAARQVGDELPPADRRRRPHHAVQLSRWRFPPGRCSRRWSAGTRCVLKPSEDVPHTGTPPGGDPARGRASARGDPAGARRGASAGAALVEHPGVRWSPSPVDRHRRQASARPAAACTSGSRSRWAARTR